MCPIASTMPSLARMRLPATRSRMMVFRSAVSAMVSVAVGRIDGVEALEERRPFEEPTAARAGSRVKLPVGVLDDFLRRKRKLGVARERGDLHLAGPLQAPHVVESLGDAGARGEE